MRIFIILLLLNFYSFGYTADPLDPFKGLDLSTPIMPVPVVYDPEERDQVFAFCARYNLGKKLTTDVYEWVKGKALKLNHHGVPNLDYTAALLLYSKSRTNGELLFDLFSKAPTENRRSIWNVLVMWRGYKSEGPALDEIFYDLINGSVHASNHKLPGTVSLAEKLFALPQEYGLKTTDGKSRK
jgi:hypothetical protein